jgi:hypothetical protein
MSVGGIFQIITNTGIQDKLIMATDRLMDNIKRISCDRMEKLKKKYPSKSRESLLNMDEAWMPILADIEKTHILFINSTFKPFVAMAHEYSKTVPRGGVPSLNSTFSFMLPILGEFVNDAVLYVELVGLAAVSALDKVRYVELLGHRLMKSVSFKVSNTVIDTYTSNNYNAYYQYKVPIQKDIGYRRMIGQEVPHTGYLTADPAVDEHREYRYFGDGPQTFKNVQPTVAMWIPMLFWFKDMQCSLPNFLLPIGQTEIEISFEAQQNLVAYATYGGTGAYKIPTIGNCYLYLNHLFLLPEVHKIFLTRFGFQLIRVHRNHSEILTDSTKSILLHQLKWPTECLYIAFRPFVNLNNSQTWYKNTNATSIEVPEAVVLSGSILSTNKAIYYEEEQVVSSLSLETFGVTIYPTLQPEFYNNYIPYRYGSFIKTPQELGWYMMNFNNNPGDHQPSGHFNISRSRELYLNYQSAVDKPNNEYIISQNNPVELIVLADCINFLLYKGGNLVLRFST